MKIYTGNNGTSYEVTSAEVVCNKTELDTLINMLVKFQTDINHYLEKNPSSLDLGFTHVHFQLENPNHTKDDADLVFYVDLDDRASNP